MIVVNRQGIALLEYYQIPESELYSDTYRPLLVTFMAVRYEGQFLLVHHRQRDSWELPGGHIESGENARDCAARELFEETGQRVEHLELRAVVKYHDRSDKSIYYGTLFSGELESLVPFLENDEISEITYWDGKTDIGYIDRIDRKVIGLIQRGNI